MHGESRIEYSVNGHFSMIFRLEAVPEQYVRRYFLQVKKHTFKRIPGSRTRLPTQPIPWWCNIKHSQVPEPSIFVKMVVLTVLSVLTMVSYHTKPPPYDF